VVCPISFLAPEGLKFKQTDQYDPNPWPQYKLREWHLTATTPAKKSSVEFVALMRPHRADQKVPRAATLKPIEGGYLLSAELSDGRVAALLPTDDEATLTAGDLTTTGKILVQRRGKDGSIVHSLRLD